MEDIISTKILDMNFQDLSEILRKLKQECPEGFDSLQALVEEEV